MISLRNVSVVFNAGTDREVRALHNFSLDLQNGEWLTVIGPNGSGKSTLLRVLSGAIPATSGRIECDGKDITNWPQHHRAAIFQHLEQDTGCNLVPSMTVEENLVLAFSRQGIPSFSPAINTERRDSIRQCLAEFGMGLEGQMKRQMRFLSGGQRAAVVIAKAILQKAKILLLDEITASLDPHTAPLLLDHIMRVVDSRSLGAVMVTHDMEEAIRCRRGVVFLHHGVLAAVLRAEQVSPLTLRDLFANSILSKGTDKTE